MMVQCGEALHKITRTGVIFLFLVVCTFQTIHAFSQNDTLQFARAMADTGAYQEANNILEQYNKHNVNLEALLLQAKLLGWLDASSEAIRIYEKALGIFPDSPEVKLRYGTLLFELSKWHKSKSLFQEYAEKDSDNLNVQIKLGWIDLWLGRTEAARHRVTYILRMEPENAEALTLRTEIKRLTAPYLHGEFKYLTDDQPHDRQQYSLGVDWYVSWLVAPTAGLGISYFNVGDSLAHTREASLGNTFQIPSIGLKLKAIVGLFQYQETQKKTLGTWNVTVSQPLFKSLRLEAMAGEQPYQYTVRSIARSTPLMQQESQIKLVFDHKDRWLAEAAYIDQQFLKDQHVRSAYGWGLFSPLMTKNLTLHFGYAYSYKDSDTLTYEALRDETGQPIFDSKGRIQGIYDPYFSPFEQHIHDVLASAYIHVGNKLTWSVRTSYGFWSKASIPYLFQDLDQNQNVFVNRETTSQRFYPWVLETTVKWKIAPLLELSFKYAYQELLFYKSHTANIRIQYQLPHE